MSFDAIQSNDEQSTAAAAENKVAKRVRQRLRQETREVEAEVRTLLSDAEDYLVDGNDAYASQVLAEVHWYLWLDPSRGDVLAPGNSDLDAKFKVAFRRMHDHRVGGHRPDPRKEYKVLAEIARAQGHLSSIIDPTRYVPVRLESLSNTAASQSVEDPSPVGRRRMGADDARDPDQNEVVIPHQDCEHILATAEPREGKDSTLVNIGMNLWKEHGYSYFSILDDGRMETPMLPVPNDETAIRNNLERFSQQPEPFAAKVYVPRMQGLPPELPANFEVFTLGIDQLNPHLILRLAGVTTNDPTTEQRIKQALEKTLNRTGHVDELVQLLMNYSEGMEATIEWTEKQDRRDGEGSVETFQASYEMEAENAVRQAAQRLAQLAGEGLITSPDADTNLYMKDVLADQENAAVLCCDHLKAGQEGLKYTIMDLWLRLIFSARDDYPRLPRACVEIRELKNVAPSQLSKVRYKDAVRALQQTIYEIASQGGSRRVMLLGSTQKWTDVYRPVRGNMATKIFLKLGSEQITDLKRRHDLSHEQIEQLERFETGMGMIYSEGQFYWPIEFRGAPCALGLGDKHWLDRYGKAWGARVRETPSESWTEGHQPDYWVEVTDYDVRVDGSAPDVGDWYLLDDDFPDCIEAEDITSRLVDWVLRNRREYPVKSDLRLEPTGHGDRQRDISLKRLGREETSLEEVAEMHDVPGALRPWLSKEAKTRDRYIEVLTAIRDEECRSSADIADHVTGWNSSALRNHMSRPEGLDRCQEKESEFYELTLLGEQALEIDWDQILREAGEGP